jgi:tRNA-specific 2-thiouridylase
MMHEYTELDAAKKCAEELSLKLHTVDARESFDNLIKTNFADEYSKGRTPNPCILCNEKVKFRALLDYAISNGFDAIATGHYARIVKPEGEGRGRYAVAMAEDKKKDQSYMLYRLSEDILSKLILPLSEMTKEEVRELSSDAGLSVSERKDSQEICFLPDGNYADYVEGVKGIFPKGNFVDPDGRVLGEHKGIIRYTVGQRKGLGISLGERAFVTKIDPQKNEIVLSPSMEGEGQITLNNTVFSGLKEGPVGEGVRLLAKVRYTAPLAPCTVFFEGEGRLKVLFDYPVKSAPGQSCVLYDGDTVAFGGIIN